MGVCLLIGSLADAAHFTSFISCPVNRCVYTGTLINFYTEAKSIVTSIWKKNIFFSLWVYEFFLGGGYFVSVIFLKILIGSKCNEGVLYTNLNKKNVNSDVQISLL